jgi:DNA invertase Pin-like site-specific DNA recombinase
MRDEKRDPPRIAFYTRISTDEDHQKYSLGAQKERLEAFCKAQWDDDWKLHKVYRDTESGTHMN